MNVWNTYQFKDKDGFSIFYFTLQNDVLEINHNNVELCSKELFSEQKLEEIFIFHLDLIWVLFLLLNVKTFLLSLFWHNNPIFWFDELKRLLLSNFFARKVTFLNYKSVISTLLLKFICRFFLSNRCLLWIFQIGFLLYYCFVRL